MQYTGLRTTVVCSSTHQGDCQARIPDCPRIQLSVILPTVNAAHSRSVQAFCSTSLGQSTVPNLHGGLKKSSSTRLEGTSCSSGDDQDCCRAKLHHHRQLSQSRDCRGMSGQRGSALEGTGLQQGSLSFQPRMEKRGVRQADTL